MEYISAKLPMKGCGAGPILTGSGSGDPVLKNQIRIQILLRSI